MNLRKILLIVLLILFVFHPQFSVLWGKEIHSVSLEEVLSIGRLDDDVLFQWVGIVADSRGYLYITDAMDYALKKFGPLGNLIKRTGNKGQGPGEFLAPRFVDCSKRFFYVTDQYAPGIQVFDRDLNFTRRIFFSFPVADLKVLSDDKIAIATLSASKTGKVIIIDSKGEIIREIVYSDRESSLMMNLVSFDFDNLGNLYLAYTFQDKIEKFNNDGEKVWSRKFLKIRKVKKKKIASFFVPTEVVYKDIAIDSFGNLFILGGHFSKNRSRDVYVLNPEGERLVSFTLSDTSHCIYIDSKDFLYSRANEGVTLKKYRMKYIHE